MTTWLHTQPILQQLILGALLILVYISLRRIGKRALITVAEKKQVTLARTQFVVKVFHVSTFCLFAAMFILLLGIGYGDISLFLSSIFAVLGVALVAQWSILSNISASVLIFFVFPYRIGDQVKVCEKDEDISGVIIDITMFHVLLRHENGNIITYPNTLLLQKGVIKIVGKAEPLPPSK
ncbi:mechanosensitive ion channel family protein [Vibrio sp. Isolate23]|uniref:mechanosensitive ion channel domain-containing protein n=1 Tax=unclassified Vibrio TaxID=2614977 RepID=UPI001EFE6FD4|nr:MULTISPECIES: mechanosensitive ion channel family protein [unclassified Vibrio]MCG9678519.1 mechanosensitive ion channel family protein [Vibrio sp. Isolate24]MCG9683260.1 mechanosensitive ion channel family protein [Vibrio sp. Isolate23]